MFGLRKKKLYSNISKHSMQERERFIGSLGSEWMFYFLYFVLWVSFSLKETQLSFILNTIMWFFSFLIYSFKIALRILWSKRDPVSTSLTNQICQAVISISCLAQLRWQWDSGTHKKESQARRPASSHCTYIWSRWRGFWCSGRPAE